MDITTEVPWSYNTAVFTDVKLCIEEALLQDTNVGYHEYLMIN